MKTGSKMLILITVLAGVGVAAYAISRNMAGKDKHIKYDNLPSQPAQNKPYNAFEGFELYGDDDVANNADEIDGLPWLSDSFKIQDKPAKDSPAFSIFDFSANAETKKKSAKSIDIRGLEFIKKHEGFSAYKYDDATGESIGYGHFIKPLEFISEPISKEKGEELLKQDVSYAEEAINSYVKVGLNQGQFNALASFVYNVGRGAFKSSTLLRLLNNGDYKGAAAEFSRWNKATINGTKQVVSALIRRRKEEAEIFNYG